jgi:hypothetical protein
MDPGPAAGVIFIRGKHSLAFEAIKAKNFPLLGGRQQSGSLSPKLKEGTKACDANTDPDAVSSESIEWICWHKFWDSLRGQSQVLAEGGV